MLRSPSPVLHRAVASCAAALAVLLFAATARAQIQAQIFQSSSSNQSFSVTYDKDSAVVGSPVTVHVVGQVYVSPDDDPPGYHFGGDYNRFWEGGSGSYAIDAQGPWGYALGGATSIDRYIKFTPTAAGTFRIGVMLVSYPNIEQVHAYINFTAQDGPAFGINSATAADRMQGEDARYQITTTRTASSYGASSLPDAASVNSATGWIGGRLNQSGNPVSAITATLDGTTDTKSLAWNIQAAQIANTSNVSGAVTDANGFSVLAVGQAITVALSGSTNFPFGHTECVIWRPDGIGESIVTWGAQSQSFSYTPTAGPGIYFAQARVADLFGNYVDRWVIFRVNRDPVVTLLSPVTQTVTAGTTLAITATAGDPDGDIDGFNLDILRPRGDWNFQGQFATGAPWQEGYTANYKTANFTFTDVGNYVVRAAAHDPLTWYHSAEVTIRVVPPVPVINSSPTASGRVGTAFSYTITATNSPTFFSSSGLPAGVTFSSSTGLLSGTPTQAGNYSVVLLAANAGGAAMATLTLTILPGPPAITGSATANATFGSPFTYQIAASNNPTSFTATALPSGLSINTGTGLISGTPGQAGNFNIAVTATNAGGTGTAALGLAVAKATPVGIFPSVTVYNQGLLQITSAMLHATFAHPSNPSAPAPTGTVTYSGVRQNNPGQTFNPLTSTSVVGLTSYFGPLIATATYAGDANYNGTTAQATFQNIDNRPPTIPAQLARELLGPNSFSLSWGASSDSSGESGVIYEISLDDGQHVFGSSIRPVFAANNLLPGLTYTVRVRTRDSFGNTSSWSAPLSVTTPTSGPDLTPRWMDINSDGIPDEIFEPGTSVFSYRLTDVTTTTVPTTTWQDGFVTVTISYATIYYALNRVTNTLTQYDSQYHEYTTSISYMVPTEDTTTIEVGTPEFSILTEPGYKYALVRAISSTQFQRILSPTVWSNTTSSIQTLPFAYPWPTDAFYAYPILLARIAQPPSGIALNVPGVGNVQIGSNGSVSGTVSLPNGINVRVANGTATVSLPSSTVSIAGTTVTVSGGVGTNGPLNVGASVDLGSGITLVVDSAGHGSVSLPGGTISVGPGSVTLSTPGGFGITVSGNGAVGISLPVGSSLGGFNLIDLLGRILGNSIGSNSRVIIDEGGWQPASGVDFGVLGVGTHTGRVTNDDRPVPAPANVFTFTITVKPPPPALRSRDRFLTGTIDVSSDYYRSNNLEFVNTTTGENLGTFRLDGTSGTHVYNSKDDILSDDELDGVLNGTVVSSSARVAQRVVFWRESPGSSTIHFSTVFNAVGSVSIRVKDSQGSLLETTSYQLTSEPNFGGLLDHLAARIASADMPAVSAWSLLPDVDGIPDPDDDIIIAAAAPTRQFSTRARSATIPIARSVALAAWSTNFLAKVATAADEMVSYAESGAVGGLKIGGGFIKGFVDGAWDGLKSDATGIAEMGKMIGDGFHGEFHRVKAIWDGIIIILGKVKAGGGGQIFDQMLTKFVDSAQVSVPWNNVGGTSDQWGVGAYIVGYTGGFITEQVIVISVGGGLISKAGQAMKTTLAGTRLGQITAGMVGVARKFVSGSFLAASQKVSAFGTETVRALRKAFAEMAALTVSIPGGTATIGELVTSLVERLGSEGVTWQKISDNAFALCVNEAEVLRIGVSLHPQLARLQSVLGSILSRNATEGFLKLWPRMGPQGVVGDCTHLLFEAPVSQPQMVRILEIANGSVITLEQATGAWSLHPFTRGFFFERIVAEIRGYSLLPPGFRTIDIWVAAEGRVISIKSLNVTAATYQDTSALTSKLNGYVDTVSTYSGLSSPYSGVPAFSNASILARELELTIKPGSSSAQRTVIEAAKQRAAGLPKPVVVNVREIP